MIVSDFGDSYRIYRAFSFYRVSFLAPEGAVYFTPPRSHPIPSHLEHYILTFRSRSTSREKPKNQRQNVWLHQKYLKPNIFCQWQKLLCNALKTLLNKLLTRICGVDENRKTMKKMRFGCSMFLEFKCPNVPIMQWRIRTLLQWCPLLQCSKRWASSSEQTFSSFWICCSYFP